METWVEGYLASSNQWALALGLAEAPLLVPELLKLIDESCKSKPDARLANVVLDVIRTELSRRKPGQKPRRGDGPQVTVSASARRLELTSFAELRNPVSRDEIAVVIQIADLPRSHPFQHRLADFGLDSWHFAASRR